MRACSRPGGDDGNAEVRRGGGSAGGATGVAPGGSTEGGLLTPGIGVDVEGMAVLGEAVDEGAEARTRALASEVGTIDQVRQSPGNRADAQRNDAERP